MLQRFKLICLYLNQQYKVMFEYIKIRLRLNKIYIAQQKNLNPQEYLKLEIEKISLEYDLLSIEKKLRITNVK